MKQTNLFQLTELAISNGASTPAGVLHNGLALSTTDSKIYRWDQTASKWFIAAEQSGDWWQYAFLVGASTVNTTAYANVSGMSFQAEPFTRYDVELMGRFQTAATTTGIGIAFDVPAGATVTGMVFAPSATTTAMVTLQTADDTVIAPTTGVAAANTNYPMHGVAFIEIGATGGTVQLRQRSEIASSNTILASGFQMKWRSTGCTSSGLAYAPSTNDLRLSFVSGDPTPVSDLSLQLTIYLNAYKGTKIGLNLNNQWSLRDLTAVRSISVPSVGSDTVYDIFANWNQNTNQIDLSATAWASLTARTTAITRQNGIWTLSGDITKRYLGSVLATSTGAESSESGRLLWNVDNQVPMPIAFRYTSGSWSFTSAFWREMSGGTFRVRLLDGLGVTPLTLGLKLWSTVPAVGGAQVGIAKDSTGGVTGESVVSVTGAHICTLHTDVPGLGYHYYAATEQGNPSYSAYPPAVLQGTHQWLC